MFLALCTSEALAQMVSHVAPTYFVIGMAGIAGLLRFFMLFIRFMILPSDFPEGLKWTYHIAFHTYSCHTLMVTQFQSLTFDDPLSPFRNGHEVLKFYEIEDVNRWNDMIALACYAVGIHLISFIVSVSSSW